MSSSVNQQNVPQIEGAKILFIKVFTLPDLIAKPNALRNEYTFISSLPDYIQYYTDYEKTFQNINKKIGLAKIPELGYLKPLNKRHTMHSFWKAFRLRYEKEKARGLILQDLFLFLPLRIKIPISNLSVNKKEFAAKMFIYIFPFGSCTINMEVDVVGKFFFDEFIDLTEQLRNKSTIKGYNYNFEDLAKIFAKKINDALFNQGDTPIQYSTHSVIFIEKTSFPLTFDMTMPNLWNQISSIAALLAGDKDMPNQTKEKINKILSCKLKEIHSEEILLFRRNRTILYPSHSWIEDLQLKTKKKIEEFCNDPTIINEEVLWRIDRSLGCMCDNYRSFLNVIFAVDRLLHDYLLLHKNQIPAQKLQTLAESFFKVFPSNDMINDERFYYYPQTLEIVSYIELHDAIKEIRS